MDRAERIGLGAAFAGHVVLFGLLSVGFLATPNPDQLKSTPIEVSLVEDVGLFAEAPVIEPPAPSIAPEEGAPADAAPPPPDLAPPAPAPLPEPVPAPAPEPRPAPKPAPKAPAPKREPPAERPPEKKKAAPKREAPKAAPKKAAAAKGSGNDAAAKKARPRGSRLGDDFLKGLSAEQSPRKSTGAPAQRVGAQQLANIASAILRQVQPCADRQPFPGPGAERIRVTIRLQLAEDGSLRARPTVTDRDGVDDGNRRYVEAVDRLAIATFTGCSPLRGLPAELYDAPGGWRDFKLRYSPRG